MLLPTDFQLVRGTTSSRVVAYRLPIGSRNYFFFFFFLPPFFLPPFFLPALPPWMRRFGMMEAISDGTLHVSFLPPDLTSTCRSSFSPNNALRAVPCVRV